MCFHYIPSARATRATKKSGDFAETTAFERYGVKSSEKANMHNEHWLTSTAFSPSTTSLLSGICIQVQRCSKHAHDHVASL